MTSPPRSSEPGHRRPRAQAPVQAGSPPPGSHSDEARQITIADQHEILLAPRQSPEDPYTAAVVKRMGEDIWLSLRPEQQEHFRQALRASRRLRDHAVDLRGVVPFFFWHVYYVLVIGREKPDITRLLALEQRRRAYLLERAILALVVLGQVGIVLLVVLGLLGWV